jgi:hypothetical protein
VVGGRLLTGAVEGLLPANLAVEGHRWAGAADAGEGKQSVRVSWSRTIVGQQGVQRERIA